MEGLLGFLALVVILLVAVLILIWPVKIAARAMGATRTGGGWCFLALLGASVMQGLGAAFPVYGNIIAFLLSSAAFAAILGTDFLRGIGIAILHIIISVGLIVVLGLCGLTLTGLLAL